MKHVSLASLDRRRHPWAEVAAAGLAAMLCGCKAELGTPTSDAEAAGQYDVASSGLKRLTRPEFERSLKDLLGVTVTEQVETDIAKDGFSTIGAGTASYSEVGVEKLDSVALASSEAVLLDPAKRAALLDCEPASLSDPCVEDFLKRFGTKAWRRPLTEVELARYRKLANEAAGELGEPWGGLAVAVAGLLESPNFAYRVELGEPDPAQPTRLRYTGYEMATRLSYLVWSTTPDQDLLDAVARGELDDAEGVRLHTQRLLDSPRSKDGLRRFWSEYWQTAELETATKDASAFPNFTVTLAQAFQDEVLHLSTTASLDAQADMLDLFRTTKVFVNAESAAFYGVDYSAGGGFMEATLPADSPRVGILALGGFLAANARATRTSPTLRGRFIRTRILCDKINEPPPGVSTVIPNETDASMSLREKMETLTSGASCSTCHRLMDPLGFAFEKFDGIGRYRSDEGGIAIDTAGQVNGTEFADAAELGRALAESPDVAACMARQLYRFASGHVEKGNEANLVNDLGEAFAAAGHGFQELLLSTVTSDGFRFAVPQE